MSAFIYLLSFGFTVAAVGVCAADVRDTRLAQPAAGAFLTVLVPCAIALGLARYAESCGLVVPPFTVAAFALLLVEVVLVLHWRASGVVYLVVPWLMLAAPIADQAQLAFEGSAALTDHLLVHLAFGCAFAPAGYIRQRFRDRATDRMNAALDDLRTVEAGQRPPAPAAPPGAPTTF